MHTNRGAYCCLSGSSENRMKMLKTFTAGNLAFSLQRRNYIDILLGQRCSERDCMHLMMHSLRHQCKSSLGHISEHQIAIICLGRCSHVQLSFIKCSLLMALAARMALSQINITSGQYHLIPNSCSHHDNTQALHSLVKVTEIAEFPGPTRWQQCQYFSRLVRTGVGTDRSLSLSVLPLWSAGLGVPKSLGPEYKDAPDLEGVRVGFLLVGLYLDGDPVLCLWECPLFSCKALDNRSLDLILLVSILELMFRGELLTDGGQSMGRRQVSLAWFWLGSHDFLPEVLS